MISTLPPGVPQGTITYTHSWTESQGTSFVIYASTGYRWTSRSIGYTVRQDLSTCPGWIDTNGDGIVDYWPPHLHQTDSGSGWYRNDTMYPTSNDCVLCYWSYPITTWGYHQTGRYWTCSY